MITSSRPRAHGCREQHERFFREFLQGDLALVRQLVADRQRRHQRGGNEDLAVDVIVGNRPRHQTEIDAMIIERLDLLGTVEGLKAKFNVRIERTVGSE